MHQDNRFFAFLRYCLNDSCPLPQYSVDWKNLMEWAEQQAIVGIIFSGIEKARERVSIPREQLLQWIGSVQQIESQNRLLNKRCVEVCKQFQELGSECCILKGQGNAIMYPNQLRRTSGDIDVILFNDRRGVTEKIKSMYPNVHENYIHIDYPIFNDVPVEVHFVLSYANNPIYNWRINKWFKKQGKSFIEWKYLPDKIGKIPVPCPEFNIIYQLIHMMHHFFDEGIGLRQMIDYYYLLKSGNNNQVQGSLFKVNGFTKSMEETLKYLNLDKFAGAVMYIMKEVLGLDGKYLIVPVDGRRGKTLLNEILKGGNFGHHSGLDQKNALKKYFQKTWRNMKLVKEYPVEALCEPFFRTWHFLWRLAHQHDWGGCRLSQVKQ